MGVLEQTKMKKKYRTFLAVLLLVYAGFLVYAMFFSERFGRGLPAEAASRVNLIPFQEIRRFLVHWDKVGPEYALINTAGNILAFVPPGVICPVLFPALRRWFRMAGTGFLISLGIELLQLLSGAGVFDVDDLILNTAGALLGWVIFALLQRIIQNRRKTLEK